jgi:hypothetical protein
MKKFILIVLLLLTPQVGWAKADEMPRLDEVILQPQYRISPLFLDDLSSIGLKNAADAWNVAAGNPEFIVMANNPEHANIWVSSISLAQIVEGKEIYTLNGVMFPLSGVHCFIILNEHKRYNVETMTHEIGHCLGFAHQPKDKKSIMFPYSGEKPRSITKKISKWLRRALNDLTDIDKKH